VEPKKLEAKRKEEEETKKAWNTVYLNNLGAPTRPTRKMEDFMMFVQSGDILQKNFDFLTYAMEINTDQLAGLDSYTSIED
jgi:hypothetical protein